VKPLRLELIQQIIFFVVPTPRSDLAKNNLIKEPGKNQERTGDSFMKTVGSLEGFEIPRTSWFFVSDFFDF
jgi:hypothetical protein